ncbi:MAG: 3-oxoacyl-ACP synthase [Bacteroidetes bacterium]|nr:3-oxoacyl-ACP synthase [Bacteroidota bacterium]
MNEPLYITQWSIIRKEGVIRNEKVELNNEIFTNFATFLKSLYKKEEISYPKFYKMDNLSKLGFLGAEMLLKENSFFDRYKKEEIGIVIMNSSSSLDTDLAYFETIKDKTNYFPSPSVFVYTLPNILIGEICIRHKINGENAFLVSESFDPELMIRSVSLVMGTGHAQACLCGWVEVLGENFESLLFLIEKEKNRMEYQPSGGYSPFNNESLIQFYQNK